MNNPSKVVSGYKLDGTAVVSYLDPEFVATLGPAAMGNPANQAWLDSIWAYTVAQSQTSAANSYYSASLMLQSMIVMSGNSGRREAVGLRAGLPRQRSC